VWFVQTGQFPPIQLLVDCPSKDFPGCFITSERTNPDLWESRSMKWSPENDALLISLHLPGENRAGLAVLPAIPNERARDVRPPIFRYQFGAWEIPNAEREERLLVSGAAPDGRNTIAWLNRDGSLSELIYDAEASGLWMGYANQAADGRIFALGAPGNRGGTFEPLRVYDVTGGRWVTPHIPDSFPLEQVERVEWSPDGRGVLVQAAGKQYTANVGGDVRDISGQVAGAQAINWVAGELPPSQDILPTAIPTTAAAPLAEPGGPIQVGQQLRVYVTELNLRAGAGVEYEAIRAPLTTGDTVTVLEGPVNTPDGMVWWRVRAADGLEGWVAARIGVGDTIGP
jgi:hypothetical protein